MGAASTCRCCVPRVSARLSSLLLTRETTPPAKTAAQATAPILTTFPQDRWSKYLFSVAGLSLSVIWNPVTTDC